MTRFACLVVAYGLNTLWQAPLVAAIAWLAEHLLKGLPAVLRHRVWVLALAMEVALPACALRLGWRWHTALGAGTGAEVRAGLGAATAHAGLVLPAGLLIGLAVAYGLVLAVLGLRLIWSAGSALALAVNGRPVELAGWDELAAGIADVQLMESAKVSGPVTVGVWKRVVLVPLGSTQAISRHQVRATLAHELAHVARHDFTKGLLYHACALPLAFHPAVRWTLSKIAETREMVCDQMAAQRFESRDEYAHLLLQLAVLFARQARTYEVHAIGMFDANRFERRLSMLNEQRTRAAMGWAKKLAVAGLLVSGSGTAMALRVGVAAQPAEARDGTEKVPAGVMAGQVKFKAQPVYPAEAKEKKIEGTVVLAAVIGQDGAVQQLKVLSGPPELQASAVDAVRQWVYTPFLLNGKPTEVETTITVTYSVGN